MATLEGGKQCQVGESQVGQMTRIVAYHKTGAAKALVLSGGEASDEDSLKRKLADAFQLQNHLELKLKIRFKSNWVDLQDPSFISDMDELKVCDEDLDEFVHLNVGGKSFVTSLSTVQRSAPDSMLAKMLNGSMSAGRLDANGQLLIDRSPTYFEPVLNYLRTGKILLDDHINPEGVLEEAVYFGVEGMLEPLREVIGTSRADKGLNREEVVRLIASTPVDRELRLQGVNLQGADLSKLDLRQINFKYCNMKGCNLNTANLSHANLERADLSGASLDGAQLLGVKMLCANLQSASLKSCNFDDPSGFVANLEGVNLSDAVLEGSNMARVNLRLSKIKRGNLKNCDLRAASLAGADLEYCDASGSDLGEANLRGANLKDTTLESMQTPLHMAQAIR